MVTVKKATRPKTKGKVKTPNVKSKKQKKVEKKPTKIIRKDGKNGVAYTKADKQKFLDMVKKTGGIIAPACRKFVISRTTHYNWKKSDPEYAQEYEDCLQEEVDFGELALIKLVREGNIRAIEFYLKAKAKDRGYYDKIQNDLTSGDKAIESTGFVRKDSKDDNQIRD